MPSVAQRDGKSIDRAIIGNSVPGDRGCATVFKRLLRRSPRLYSALQRCYYASLKAGEGHLLGTKLQEIRWRMHKVDTARTGPTDHAHRSFLVARISNFAPFESILEVGCNAGPNLVALGRAYPGVQLYGLDINRRAIEAAKAALSQESVWPANVFVGSATNLRKFAEKSVDVVLTDATLMYIGPDKITRAISEMVRVARKGIILNEWHLFDRHGAEECSHWHYAHWLHDYVELLKDVPGAKAVQVERLPPGLWDSDKGWEEYGALVEVEV